MNAAAKPLLLVVWGACFASLFAEGESFVFTAARGIFWFLIAAHLIECVVFLKRLRAAPGPLLGHLLQTFVFGVAHVESLPELPD